MIKVLSLTLGLGVGLILFARVAFELSFDTFFDQVEDLYSVHVRYNDDKTGEEDGSRILFAPIPEALRQEFPETQYATKVRGRIVSWGGSVQASFDDGGFPLFPYDGNQGAKRG